jgi:hypothetical protein
MLHSLLSWIISGVTYSVTTSELFHIKDKSGVLKADQRFKDTLQRAGFKWKNLCNDPSTGKRSQIMQLDRPKDPTKIPAFENPRGL